MILIYQAGKVGSITILKTLIKLGYRPFHCHRIMTDGEFGLGFTRQQKDHILGQENIKSITPIRDPLARNLSAFFHQHTSYWGENSYSFERAKHQFINLYNHTIFENWFDQEIKQLLGIDVFAQPFNKQRGYQIYKKDNKEVLLIRLEDLNQVGGDAFREFLGIPKITFQTHNQNQTTEYQKFLKRVKFPKDFVDEIYSGKLAQHFYMPNELASFKRRWT